MKKLFLAFCGVVFLLASVQGQSKYGAFGELIEDFAVPEVTTISANSIPGTNNKANNMRGQEKSLKGSTSPYRYLSYKIEILTTRSPLDLNHPVFKNYKGVNFNQTSENGFSYYTGDFSNEAEAKVFLDKYVRTKYPKARLVKERKYLK